MGTCDDIFEHKNNYKNKFCFRSFFEFYILDFFENIIIEPKNIIRIIEKSSEMNVSQRVDVARYPIFSLAPNIRKVTCFQKS